MQHCSFVQLETHPKAYLNIFYVSAVLTSAGQALDTASSKALTREREHISQSQFIFPSCLERPMAVLAGSSSLER